MAFFLVSMCGIQTNGPDGFRHKLLFDFMPCSMIIFTNQGMVRIILNIRIPAAIVIGKQRIHNEVPLRRMGAR